MVAAEAPGLEEALERAVKEAGPLNVLVGLEEFLYRRQHAYRAA